MQPESRTPKKIIRLRGAMERSGLSKTTIYRLSNDPASDFPKPVRPTPHTVGWYESEIDAWVESRRGVQHEPAACNDHMGGRLQRSPTTGRTPNCWSREGRIHSNFRWIPQGQSRECNVHPHSKAKHARVQTLAWRQDYYPQRPQSWGTQPDKGHALYH
ncbi:MAG: AlpA family phage regulatory protein [Candidatus Thiothrix singaporensis]|uniref:AlpA family phage regulatory protein n=1 Tax=Candidatus Thiothrix singaporensis TaxID=2799669 RepID=A0A7L6AW81_9GAMM|nr:MAG: AlpA family phage regulatory protein [Candidatus Thiothrix singaporensis]